MVIFSLFVMFIETWGDQGLYRFAYQFFRSVAKHFFGLLIGKLNFPRNIRYKESIR